MEVLRNNIIKKTILDLQYNGSRDGFSLQNELAGWANNDLIKTIDEQLEKFNQPGVVTRIDNLNIEIEVWDANNWMENVSKKIAEQINYALKNKLSAKLISTSVEKVTTTKSFFDAFIYFLQNGYLPWWSDRVSQQEFFADLEKLFKTGLSPELKEIFIESTRSELVKSRIVLQVPDAIFPDMVTIFLPAIKQQIKQLWNGVTELALRATQTESKILTGILKKTLLDMTSLPSGQQTVEIIVKSFIKSAIASGTFAFIEKEFVTIKEGTLKKEDVLIKEVADTIFRLHKKPGIEETSEEQKMKVLELVNSKDFAKVEDKPRYAEAIKQQEGIYINNAGLVIVASFLPLLFKKLSLVEEGKINQVDKSVCLVQYLASGNETVAEFELVLAKILCGVDIQRPVDTAVQFEENEKKEVNEVLLSVIEYWNILKDTSVGGLRESFLMRGGKLWFENNEWHLQVEQKSYDMLLQLLPWNISMIKLPWMKHMIKTEWVT